MGAHPPDAHRGRLARHAGRDGAARPRARPASAAAAPRGAAADPARPARDARRRLPRRALHLPGRVRLRRAPVPARAPPDLQMLAAGIGLVTARDLPRARRRPLRRWPASCHPRPARLHRGRRVRPDLPHFPLYMVEAVLVEPVFLRAAWLRPVAAGRARRRGRSARSAWPPSGAGPMCGCPIPWPSALLPEAAVAGLLAAVAGGAVGGFVGGALVHPRPFAPLRAERLAALVAGVVLMGLVGWSLPLASHGPRSRERHPARRAGPRGGRDVEATVRIRPPRRRGPRLPERHRLAGGRQRARPARARRPRRVPDHEARSPCTAAGRRCFAFSGATRSCPRRSTCRATGPFPRPRCPPRPAFTRRFPGRPRILQRERKEGVPARCRQAPTSPSSPSRSRCSRCSAWALIRLESETAGRRPAPTRGGGARHRA